MENSRINEQMIKANNSRLRIISLISLGFSVFVLFTDFMVHGVWQSEHLYLFKILDIVLTIISVSSFLFFFLFKNKNAAVKKTGEILFPFLFIIWSAVITGIGFNTLGFSTLLVVVLLIASFLYLNLITSILYFVLSGFALLMTLYFMGDLKENYLSLIFLLIPIIAISVIISARNYKYKITELFNQLKLEEANKKLTDSIDNLEKTVSERTKDINTALEKAQESDRLKSSFLANISHEIRTPMNGIIGFTQLLKEPGLTHEEQKDFIRIIEQSGERMLNTLNDIIDFSKIETGLSEIVITESNINELIEFVFKFFKPEVEGKGLQLFFKNGLPYKEAIIKTDNEKVKRILLNLIKNAIKFTDKGSIEFGYILKPDCEPVSTKPGRSSELEFFVKDTGTGISEAQKEIIFERFRQGNESLDRNHEGNGLGLSISKSYAEMLDGKIWVESEVRKGSTFYFTIPFIPLAAEKSDIKNDVSQKDMEDGIKKLKILVAEDDETSYSLMKRSLQKIGKEVIHAKTGFEAIEYCKNNPDIDLILMDLKMPGMDGYEATRRIREFNQHIIIIAQTAYVLSDDKKKSLEAGCNDFISKPINKTGLFELINKYFKT